VPEQKRQQPKAIAIKEIPFHLRSGFLIVVEGRISDLSGLNFILDTGATDTIISKKIAKRLGLQLQPAQISTSDKTVEIQSAVFTDVQFGPVHATNASMLVCDLSRLSDFATNIDAVVGLDLLRLNNVTLDYDAKKVVFGSYEPSASNALARSTHRCVTVKIDVQHHPVSLIVDTGFQGILFYEERLLKRIPKLRFSGRVKEGGIRGRMRLREATLPGIRLGSAVSDLKVLLMKSPPDNVLADIDGLLGTVPLQARRIHFNFETDTLTWE
jgi:predicted aspartyl protease